MTAILPEQPVALAELPSMRCDAEPVILPGFLAGVGITTRRAPRWTTDPELVKRVVAGFAEIPDDFNPQEGQ